MLDQVITKIKAFSEALERKEKAEAQRNIVHELAELKQWRDTAKNFIHKIKSRKTDAFAKISLKNYKKVSVAKHSVLGGNRLVDSQYVLNQTADSDIRNGRRWIDKIPVVFHNTLDNIIRIYTITSGSTAAVVAEGAPKPLREKVLNAQSYQFSKLAVTDLVSQESLYALPNEQYAEFLLEAHLEHVLDRLEQIITNTIYGGATLFNSAFYSGYFTVAAGQATWHDLISALRNDYKRIINDHFVQLNSPDIIVTAPRTFAAIKNDRHGFGYNYLSTEHNVDAFVGDLDFLWWSNQLYDAINNFDQAIYINPEAFELHLLDATDTYMERVAETASERNMYRMVSEVYFALVPRYLDTYGAYPLPALRIDNMLQAKNIL